MTIYVMRHGQTNFNVLGLCNDDPSRDVHLTVEGVAQAQTAAEQLRHVGLQHIYTSQLPRTQQTAAIVNQFHNVKIDPRREINDIQSGFDGRPVADYFAAIAADRLNTVPTGGESLAQHKQRVAAFFQWLSRQSVGPVLVVAHEETLRVASAYFGGLGDAAMLELNFGNCQILEFNVVNN